jgi:hypothetical protein
MASLRKVCAVLAGEIAVLEAAIAGLLEHHQGYRAVRALPGTGPVPGAVIVAEIGDVTRFPRPAGLFSWAARGALPHKPIPFPALASLSRKEGQRQGRPSRARCLDPGPPSGMP